MRAATMLAATGLMLAACDEVRRPPPPDFIPATLAGASADPVREGAAEAAALFEDGGRGLAGEPARTARAVALLEATSEAYAQDPRWAGLPATVGFELRAARIESRAALGIRADAPAGEVARALAAAEAALRRGDRAAAAAALPERLFEPGGTRSLQRLSAPGALPQGRYATTLAAEEVQRLARAQGGGLRSALDPFRPSVEPGVVGRPR